MSDVLAFLSENFRLEPHALTGTLSRYDDGRTITAVSPRAENGQVKHSAVLLRFLIGGYSAAYEAQALFQCVWSFGSPGSRVLNAMFMLTAQSCLRNSLDVVENYREDSHSSTTGASCIPVKWKWGSGSLSHLA